MRGAIPIAPVACFYALSDVGQRTRLRQEVGMKVVVVENHVGALEKLGGTEG
jgi:hypothetical protein